MAMLRLVAPVRSAGVAGEKAAAEATSAEKATTLDAMVEQRMATLVAVGADIDHWNKTDEFCHD